MRLESVGTLLVAATSSNMIAQRSTFHRRTHIKGSRVLSHRLPRTDRYPMRTLSTAIRELGHSCSTIDVLKMDIERAEWAALGTAELRKPLLRVRQLLVEMHRSCLSGWNRWPICQRLPSVI